MGVTIAVAVAVAVGVAVAVAVGVGSRRSSGGNAERIYLVVIGDVDAPASSDAAVPFAVPVINSLAPPPA